MTVGRLAPALLVVAALACRAPRPERPEGSCTHVQAVRQLHGAPLCEDVWTCSRPPRGRFDRIGLRRVALCDRATGPVVLSTEDLRQEFSASGKYTIGRRIFDCYRIEGTYLGFATWSDQRLVTNTDVNSLGGTGNLSTFLSGFSNPITAGLDGASFRGGRSLVGGDGRLARGLGGLLVGVGLRGLLAACEHVLAEPELGHVVEIAGPGLAVERAPG